MKSFLIAALCLAAVPALAAQPATSQPAAAEVPATAPTPTTCLASLLPAALPTSVLSVCTANCWDGTTRTCEGTSCSAVDSACYSGQRGYCWSNAEGYKYCPVCKTSCPHPTCDELNGQACTISGFCFGWPPNCQKYTCPCRNGHYLCP